MKRIYLFIDYKLVGVVNYDGLLNALCAFQFHHADYTRRTYTAFDLNQQIAFSQEYVKLIPRGHWHGTMFKHEAGAVNPPPIPSYNDLLQLIDVNTKVVTFPKPNYR